MITMNELVRNIWIRGFGKHKVPFVSFGYLPSSLNWKSALKFLLLNYNSGHAAEFWFGIDLLC